MSRNLVILVGVVDRKPENSVSYNGHPVIKFDVVTTKEREGSTKQSWHHVVAFGFLAEKLRMELFQGSEVYVEGELETSKYKDKRTGEDKYWTQVAAAKVTVFKNVATKQEQEVVPLPNTKQVVRPDMAQSEDFDASDIPF